MTETNSTSTQLTQRERVKQLQQQAAKRAAMQTTQTAEAGDSDSDSNGVAPVVAKKPINVELAPDIQNNLGTRRIPPLRPSQFPDAGASVQTLTSSTRPAGTVDVLLVNPPTPDGGIWIRSQHRVGRRSRENMIWPQVSLAQLAAILKPEYTV